MIDLRMAVLADVESGARCHLRCWQETYADLVDPDRLAVITAQFDERVELWRTLINSGFPVVVGVRGTEVIGFAGAGPAHEEGVAAGFQLKAISVRQAHWGSGIGQQLLDRAVGDRACFLWVARDNPRAIAFYRRNGFSPDGAHDLDELFDHPHHPDGPTRLARSGQTSVVLVVQPGEPGGEPLDRDLELRIEVDEGPELLGEPRQGDLVVTPTRLEFLDASIGEIHQEQATWPQEARAASIRARCCASCTLPEPTDGADEAGRVTGFSSHR